MMLEGLLLLLPARTFFHLGMAGMHKAISVVGAITGQGIESNQP